MQIRMRKGFAFPVAGHIAALIFTALVSTKEIPGIGQRHGEGTTSLRADKKLCMGDAARIGALSQMLLDMGQP